MRIFSTRVPSVGINEKFGIFFVVGVVAVAVAGIQKLRMLQIGIAFTIQIVLAAMRKSCIGIRSTINGTTRIGCCFATSPCQYA